jgi:hypothetical protein
LRIGRGNKKRSEKKTASPLEMRSTASARLEVPAIISPILSRKSWV